MSAVIKKFAKAPAERLDYTIDFGAELTRLADTIAASSWVIPSNTVDGSGNTAIHLDDSVSVNYDETSPAPVYTQGGTSFTDTTATVYLSGGTLGEEYIAENRITTADGRKYTRRIIIAIQER
jgi:hypothetical protein